MGEARNQSILTTAASGVLPGSAGLSYDSELILNAIPEGVYSLDLEGRATLVNEAAARLLGWDQAELIGKRIHDIIHSRRPDGSSYPVHECPAHQTLVDGEPRHTETDVFWRRDGTTVPVDYDSRPILRNGQVVGALVAFRDRSERQRADERTRELVREQFARAKAEFQHAQLRDVLVQAPALISVTRGARHVIDTVNERYSIATGGRDVVGKTVREAFPDAPPGYADLLDRGFQSGEACSGTEIPGAVLTGSAEERFFNFTIQPLRDDAGLVYGLLTHAIDVTEQVRTTRKLEAQYRLAELLAQVGLILTKPDTLRGTLQACAESVVTYADAAFARIWTLNDAEQMLELQASAGLCRHLDGPHGRVPIGRFKIGEIAQERRPHLTNEVIGDPRVADLEWARREGLVAFAGYPLMVGSELLGVLAMFARHALSDADLQALGAVAHGIALAIQKKRHEDALRASEQHLRENEERLRAALDASATGTFRWDIRTNTLEWDDNLDRLFGLPAGQTAHHVDQLATLVHPEDRAVVGAALERSVRDGADFDLVFRVVWPDGSIHWLLDRGRMVQGAQGEALYMAGACVDVTERKQAEQELVEAERQIRARAEELAQLALALERSNRELDAFAYAASHDLRAPLRGIANLAQWIEEDLSAHGSIKEEIRDMLALMRGRMHRMEALIEGLLQYSRAGRVHQKPEPVNTGRLVREVVDLLSPPADITVDVAPDLPTIRTGRLPLQQVFLNLIGNAIKHSLRSDATVVVSAAESGQFYEFSVADNGPGIEERYVGRIWGIFQTLESRDTVEGTGIGLALVKKIVEGQGGRAWVESTPGRGATFKFLWRRGAV